MVLALAPTAQAAPIVAPTDGYTGAYRLAFVTTGTTTPVSADIADYNTFVTNAAAAVTELDDLDATWKVIGSTVTVSAKVNTSTDSAGGANDVPIYTTTGLRIANNNADLWDGNILNPIWFDNGTEAGVEGGVQEQAWTGTNADGTSADAGSIPGDGNPLGTGGRPGSNNIILVRGGYTDGNWISGPTDHDASSKHFLALSSPLSNATPEPSTLAITSVGGGVFELTLEGEVSTAYEFFSSPILNFAPGAPVINLIQGAAGLVSGDNLEIVTTDGSGNATVQMSLGGGPANFVRAVGP